jgi:putative ABC transport system permease protein
MLLRSLLRQKTFLLLNFTGLYISLTVGVLIAMLVFHERSFDGFHRDARRIYRVTCHLQLPTGEEEALPIAATPLAPALRSEFPEAEAVAQVQWVEDGVLRLDGRLFEEKDLVFADTGFFNLFHFEVISGNGPAALARPGAVLLTERTAARYFPGEAAIGKRFSIHLEDHGKEPTELEVAGILRDPPANSHLPFTMIASAASLKEEEGNWGWFSGGRFVYLRLAPAASGEALADRLTALARSRQDERDPTVYTYHLQPLAAVHSDPQFAAFNPSYTVDIQQFYWLGAIALFLLLVACINYVNLSTAIAMRKAREVGVRKTLGASRSQLAFRFLAETLVLTFAAVALAAFSVHWLLPELNRFLDRNITADWTSLPTLGFLTALGTTVALLAGLYPALVLSGFNPIQALRSRFNAAPSRSSLTLRRGLVTFQFAIAQIFIVGVIVAAMQMDYLRTKPLGFRRDGVIDIRLPQNKPEHTSALKARLADIPGIRQVSFGSGAPTSERNMGTVFNLREAFDGAKLEVAVKIVDPNYLDTYGIELAAGRFITENEQQQASERLPEDQRRYVCVVNEAAVKKLGFARPEDVLGREITIGVGPITPEVVGVVRDFHTASLHAPVSAVAMLPLDVFNRNLGLLLEPGAVNSATLAAIEKAWKAVYPNDLFESSFLDEHLASLYRTEARTFTLFQLVTLLALLINALGLVGLTAFVVEQKTKEIGIRKVLGASVSSVVALLSRDFFRLALIALIAAAPVAWWAMNRWLQDFAYRIDIRWWVFALAGLLAVAVAFLTVSFQSVRAALANPVESLRSD